jgi:hypothetical protein
MAEQRKHFYNDHKLQGYLLVALIVLELVLVALLLSFMYVEINRIIEGHLYRLHNTNTASWPEMLLLLASAMAVFMIVNIAALYLAHLIWGRYVKQTIRLFSAGLDRIIALDFSGRLDSTPGHHQIIDLLETWFAKEQDRNRQIARQVERLNSFSDGPLTDRQRREMQQILDQYRNLLSD